MNCIVCNDSLLVSRHNKDDKILCLMCIKLIKITLL